MTLIDTHCHVYSEYYDDINLVINDCNSKTVNYIISSAVNKMTMQELLELSSSIPNMYITLGIHPEDANSYSMSDIDFIESNLKNKKVVAIGEIGLDYHYDNYDRDKQIELFELQLSLAQKYNIPIVVHSREATQDTLDILKKYKVKGVIHSFSGSLETAREYIKLGYFLGVNGVVTFKNAHVKDVIKEIGLDHIVLETDSPFLTPEPYRGKTNYPSYVVYVCKYISNYLSVNVEEVKTITSNNAFSIFDRIIH